MSSPPQDTGEKLEAFRPYLYCLARTHLRNQAQVKITGSDVVQQTLLDAFAKREQFRGSTDGELAAWLRQILKNRLTDALRNQGRAKRDMDRERSLDAAIDDSFCRAEGWLLAAHSSPSEHAVKHEELLQLSKALVKLPEAQREVIVLHHLQGMKLADVARQIGRSEPAVAGLLFRGLKELRGQLSE